MEIRFEHLRAMPPAERAEFLRELAEDEALRRDYTTWLMVSKQIRSDQEILLDDRNLLVLAALHRAGLESAFDEEEQARIEASWPRMEEVASSRPFLNDILDRIRAEAADFEESWNLREGHLSPYKPVDRRASGPRPFLRTSWRAVAVAAVVAFVGILVYVARRDASWIELNVIDGQTESLALVDGSQIRLIGPTTLQYRGLVSDDVRPQRVRLSGDAFFDIIPGGPSFTVETATASVAVLGTSFGVRSRVDRTDVVVASGKVSVASREAPGSICLLSPGESCYVLQDEAPSAPVQVDLGDALAWANMFVFRNTPMSEIAAVLSQHYDVVVLVDNSLVDATITGTFERSRTLDDILNVLSKTLGARVVEIEGGFRLATANS